MVILAKCLEFVCCSAGQAGKLQSSISTWWAIMGLTIPSVNILWSKLCWSGIRLWSKGGRGLRQFVYEF